MLAMRATLIGHLNNASVGWPVRVYMRLGLGATKARVRRATVRCGMLSISWRRVPLVLTRGPVSDRRPLRPALSVFSIVVSLLLISLVGLQREYNEYKKTVDLVRVSRFFWREIIFKEGTVRDS